MKLKANIFIILIIIALLLFAVFILLFNPMESNNKNSESVIEKTPVGVLDINTELKEYNYTSGDKSYKIVYADGSWSVNGKKNIKLESSAVYNMIYTISNLKTNTVVEENATDLSKYGLLNPAATVVIIDVNETIYSVKIGFQTSTQSGYYAVINDETKVFVLSTEDYDILCGGIDSLRKKNIISINGDIYSITISNPKTKMTISPKTTSNVNASSFSKWEMIIPYHKDVNEYIFEENVINALDFTVIDFVDDNPVNYTDYGLDIPKYTIELNTTKTSYKILLGNTVDGNKIYMKLSDEPNIYTISKDSVKYRDFTPVYLLDSLVFSRNISAVERIVFKHDSIFEMNIKDDKFSVNGLEVDEELFRGTYLTFISSIISGEADKDKIGNEICRYTFNYNTGTPSETVIFYEYEEMYSAVSINGVTEFYVKRSYVNDMIESIKNLAE